MFRNKLLMIFVFALALVAIAGMADSAHALSPISCKITSVNQNGHYIGEQVILGDAPGHYGYNYTFIPDGTYTIYGTLKNIDPHNKYWVYVSTYTHFGEFYVEDIWVPAGGSLDFSFNAEANSYADALHGISWSYMDDSNWGSADTSGVKETQSAYSSHTFDEGPMSGQVAIYKDGKITYSGAPLFVLDFAY